MTSALVRFKDFIQNRLAAFGTHERRVVVAFAALLFIANVLTAKVTPITLDDEVLLSDAGVNLYMGHGFTSTAWPGQSKSEFWAGNLPLYSACLSVWLKI